MAEINSNLKTVLIRDGSVLTDPFYPRDPR